uniref:Arginine-glutamic acid dipeptide repeats protein n=1 Tax=Trichuris muris TaxID=70415 RepID=A0A5S6QAL0_TRIMR
MSKVVARTPSEAEQLTAAGVLQVETVHYPNTHHTGAGQPRLNHGQLYRNAITSDYVCFVSHDGIAYGPGECVYVDSQRPDQPYYVASIQAFKMTKRDQLNVLVKWYYRPCELPELVYDSLLQERISEEHYLPPDDAQSALREKRELFISDAVDTYSVSALRGKSYVHHYKETSSVREFDPLPDHFYYILGYNPETNRLASIQGEIRVGQSYQARVPELSVDRCPVEPRADSLLWMPERISDADLVMFLQAARSMAAFAGMCDSGSTDEMCVAAARDQTTINAFDALHGNDYDTGKALQELVKSPLPLSIEKRWSEDETKKFVKGLKQYGKNFFRIHKELLSHKQMSELVEFYYLWKKYPTAHHQRPRPRHRRVQSNVLRRTKANGNNRAASRPTSSEFLDLSSASENECESDESAPGASKESAVASSVYVCHHCYTTTSKNWHHAGKDRTLLCVDCRVHFKKYGELRPVERPSTPPPALFKPVKEDADDVNSSGIRTRRSGKEGGKRRAAVPWTDTDKAVAGSTAPAAGARAPVAPRNGGGPNFAADDKAEPKSPSSASSSSAGSVPDVEKKTPRGKGKRRRGEKESSTSQGSTSSSGSHNEALPQPPAGKRSAKKASAGGGSESSAKPPEVAEPATAFQADNAPAETSSTVRKMDTSIEESIASVVRESLIANGDGADKLTTAMVEANCPPSAVSQIGGESERIERGEFPSSLPAVGGELANGGIHLLKDTSAVLSGLLTSPTVTATSIYQSANGSTTASRTTTSCGAIVGASTTPAVTATVCSVIKENVKVKEELLSVYCDGVGTKRVESDSESNDDELTAAGDGGILPAVKEPEPKIDDGTECHRSKNAIFRRHWYRGPSNSCSRTDLVFLAVPDSPLAKKRQRDSIKRQTDIKEEKRERPSSIPSKVPFLSPFSAGLTVTTPSVLINNATSAGSTNPAAAAMGASMGLRSPTTFGSANIHPQFNMLGNMQNFNSVHDLPALQRLKEYASAAAAAAAAAGAYNPGTPSFYQAALHDPVLQHRILNGLYGPVEKERLEQELRDRQTSVDMLKRELELASKPLYSLSGNGGGLQHNSGGSLNLMGAAGVPNAAALTDSRQVLGFPGHYSPVNSTPVANFAAAGTPGGGAPSSGLPFGVDQATWERMHTDRLVAERMQLERLAALYPSNPLLRLEIDRLTAALSAIATQHHTHSHTHSHTHLHIHPSSASTSTQESTPTTSIAPSHHHQQLQQQQQSQQQQQPIWPPSIPVAAAEQLMQQYPALFRPPVIPGAAAAGLSCLDNGMNINPATLMATAAAAAAASMPGIPPASLNLPAGAVFDPLAVERLQQMHLQQLQQQVLLERDRLMSAQQQVAMQHNEMMRRLQHEGSVLSTAAAGPGGVGGLLRSVRSPLEKQ